MTSDRNQQQQQPGCPYCCFRERGCALDEALTVLETDTDIYKRFLPVGPYVHLAVETAVFLRLEVEELMSVAPGVTLSSYQRII